METGTSLAYKIILRIDQVSRNMTNQNGLLYFHILGHTKAEDLDPKLYISVADSMYCCLPESIKKILRCGVPRWDDIKDQYAKEKEFEPEKVTTVTHFTLQSVSLSTL